MGHVDTVGVIKSIKKNEGAHFISIEIPEKFSRYIVDKGSVAVDGISLTVTECIKNIFTLNIIPHTFEITVLKERKIGDEVNIEVDIAGKYFEKLYGSGKKEITKEFLNENGYF
jgi:riboflavin synthase